MENTGLNTFLNGAIFRKNSLSSICPYLLWISKRRVKQVLFPKSSFHRILFRCNISQYLFKCWCSESTIISQYNITFDAHSKNCDYIEKSFSHEIGFIWWWTKLLKRTQNYFERRRIMVRQDIWVYDWQICLLDK